MAITKPHKTLIQDAQALLALKVILIPMCAHYTSACSKVETLHDRHPCQYSVYQRVNKNPAMVGSKTAIFCRKK